MSVLNPTDPREDQASEPSTFGDILSQFEQEHKADAPTGEAVPGTVVSVTPEAVVVDIGRKMDGVLDPAPFLLSDGNFSVKPGDVLQVTVSGRNEEGYYQLSMLKVKRPTDWTGFEQAFADKAIIAGKVTEVVKGGLRVDIGVRAFMPASRSGAKDPAEMDKLVGQEIRCRITKLDTAAEDVVVDRRSILEEESAAAKAKAFESLSEGAVVHGTVRTVTDYGAFVDLGGVDGLLHIADMSWNRVGKASDVVSVGDSVEVKILKIDPASRKISLGMKQLQPDPWTLATSNLKVGDKVTGKVVRLADFGAFVEVAPGVDGLIHLSSLAWGKRVRKPSDVVKVGEVVQAAVLDIKPAEKRISLSLKEALGDPWDEVPKRLQVGMILPEVTVTNLAKFGAFVDLGDGVEGMIHIADITAERRLDHPKDVIAVGQKVRVKVLEVDRDKRRIRLGMKQLEPTAMDKFIADHKEGEVLSGLVVSVEGYNARVEISEGITAHCRLPKPVEAPKESRLDRPKVDLAAMTAMLSTRWKAGPPESGVEAPAKLRRGEVKQFKIIKMDAERQSVEVELV
ncbi:MAG: S1 RNA-binding domain-containing protein [Bryobacterales bacterium]|nr:S1 RNA-binding domain-containing protein [Bryobacterales bacterium]